MGKREDGKAKKNRKKGERRNRKEGKRERI